METAKTSSFTCQSKSFISIVFTCQVSACELQPFSCHDLANDIYSQTAKTVFNHLNQAPKGPKWFDRERKRPPKYRKYLSENENNVKSSSDIEEEGEEIAFENGSETEDTQESDNDSENDSQETESSSPETSTTFHSENLCEHY